MICPVSYRKEHAILVVCRGLARFTVAHILPVVLSILCQVRLVMEYCPAGTVLDFVRAAGKVRSQSSEYVMLCGLRCQLRDHDRECCGLYVHVYGCD